MSEYTLFFGEIELLFDPNQKRITDEYEDVYYRALHIRKKEDEENVGIEFFVLSPDKQAIVDFTSPFKSESSESEEGNVITIRRFQEQEESEHVQTNDFVLGINVADQLLDNEETLVVEFDIDPDIKKGVHHIFMFSQKRPTDYVVVDVAGNTVDCKLFNNQPSRLSQMVSKLNQVETSSGYVARDVMTRSELVEIVANMGHATFNKQIVAKRKEKIELNQYRQFGQFTLILEGTDEGATSNYHIKINI